MEIKSTFCSNDVVVLVVNGSYVDASNVKVFRDAMRAVMSDGKYFAVDMSGVDFIDSAGVGALISCLRDANARGGALALFALVPGVLALFEIMRLNKIFQLHLDRQTALNSLRN